MLCRHPFLKGGMPFPCGQCMPCRLQKRRHWTHRILLEAGEYKDNAFVTLTYSDENMPRLEDGRGNLVPQDMRAFLNRFRTDWKRKTGNTIRFFGVGEYGDRTQRPHFHLALFNYPACWRLSGSHFNKEMLCCAQCEFLYEKWKLGHVHSGRISVKSAQYIASYTTKKMTKADDERLNGRHPEFARQSNRPYGIGAGAMLEVASTLLDLGLEKTLVDVPKTLRHGGKEWPLAPYLRRKLRSLIGRDERAPDEVLEAVLEELRPVQEKAQEMATSLFPHDVRAYGRIYKQLLVSEGDQRVASMEAREKIFKKREKL